jgi:hypothetical protein
LLLNTTWAVFSYMYIMTSEQVKLLDMVRTGQKVTISKGDIDGFSYFSLISVILFSNQDLLWLCLKGLLDLKNHKYVFSHFSSGYLPLMLISKITYVFHVFVAFTNDSLQTDNYYKPISNRYLTLKWTYKLFFKSCWRIGKK